MMANHFEDKPFVSESMGRLENRDGRDLIPYLTSKMNWSRDYEQDDPEGAWKVMDLGCAHGFITQRILLPALELRISKRSTGGGEDHDLEQGTNTRLQLLGLDQDQELLEIAKEKYFDPRITYLCQDILEDCPTLTSQHGTFDKVFSFHTLHWIRDSKTVLQKFYKLLKGGGEVGFYFITSCAPFIMFDALSKDPKWKAYHENVLNILPPIFYETDPVNFMGDLLNSIGFHVIQCSKQTQQIIYPNFDEMIEEIMERNPYKKNVPDQDQYNYERAIRRIFSTLLVNIGTRAFPTAVQADYNVLLAIAKKPT